ncbi:MAG TPA: hypothetical protein VHL80_16980 [Polyangia bacterium]|nr:hypothetical protein [Polyangia bacterium]
MRSSIPVILVGVVAGVGGALVAGRFNRPAPANAAVPPAAEARPRPVVIPPGWDASLLSRVARLEERLEQRQAEAKAPPSEGLAGAGGVTDPAQQASQRERERLEHYEKELDYRSDFIDRHNQEPIDTAWSPATTQAIQERLSAGESSDGAKVKQVECRSKTCTATLTFPSPSEALSYIQQGGKAASNAAVASCNGSIMIPTPPTSAGAYDLTVLYTCR